MSMATQLRDLDRLPQLAYHTIERNDDGGMTQKQLREELDVSRQSAYRALDTLECHDLVRAERSTRDARQQVYRTS